MIKSKYFKVKSFKNVRKFENLTSGSAMCYVDGCLSIISDDSDVLYSYDTSNLRLKKIALSAGELKEQIPKALKPDFEAMCFVGGNYYIIGSGSTENRNDLVILSKDLQVLERKSIASLYQNIREEFNISEADFNIEGLVLKDDKALFFNRGNGSKQKNGIFEVLQPWSDKAETLAFHLINLPKIGDFAYTFTDAILVDEHILFLASLEQTLSVYDDGEILGSAIGVLCPKTFKILYFEQITSEYKLEGISLKEKNSKSWSFFLCDDPDDEDSNTNLFVLSLKVASI